MKTVLSVSGGQTSNYIYMNYKHDYNVFALVTTNDKRGAIKDKGLEREVLKKVPGFIGTLETEQTIRNLIDIEQDKGELINWVVGESFEDLIERKNMLPNERTRFCTIEMKMRPIFEFCLLNIMGSDDDVLKMSLGIRNDEIRRVRTIRDNNKSGFTYQVATKIKTRKGGEMKPQKVNRVFYYREVSFPLIDDMVSINEIRKYWEVKKMPYPIRSNCVGCFHHNPFGLRNQFERYPEKMQIFADLEAKYNKTFKTGGKYEVYKNLTKPLFEVERNTSFNCNCTD